MKMWEVRRGARGTLFAFDREGRLQATVRKYEFREGQSFDDGDVVDYVRLSNNERQGMSNYGSFPKHLYPAGVKVVMDLTQREQGCAVIRRGLKGENTYVIVLATNEYRCLC